MSNVSVEFAAETVSVINAHLADLGFAARDADGNDFQRGDDNGLRFKTGTAYKEVTILPYLNNVQSPAIRVLSTGGIPQAIGQITNIVESYDELLETPDGEDAIQ